MSDPTVAVAAPNELSARAGMRQAAAGGNAVDAAVAAVIVASVTEPGIVSPMGGAFVNVWPPHRRPIVIDGNVEMPGRGAGAKAFGRGLERIELDYGGGITVHGGHGSVSTPGFFAAVAQACQDHGSLPWAWLVRPAIEAVRDGYPLGTSAAYYLGASGDLFTWHPDSRQFLAQRGPAPIVRPGQLMRCPNLARSLELIAEEGAQTLYTGELAHRIAADMAGHGGLLSLEDLAAYRTVTREPLRTTLGAWDVAVNPGPSIGGPVLTAMLRLMAARAERSAEDIIEVERVVLAYRRSHLDYAVDLEHAGQQLLQLLATQGPDALAAAGRSAETVHVSAVDASGLACSITTSAGYGSGVTTPGTGLMLNNALGEPELNRRGLHAFEPGSRMPSNMAPTTARRDDGAVLAVGTPGADRITTALFQVLTSFCLDDQDLQTAIDAPRLHVAFDEQDRPRLEHEDGPGLREAAHASGLPWHTHEEITMYFGGVGAALRRSNGALRAAADPRREAATAVS
ncbi:MAG TPA: gamma-glutamyltransferase [Dermatophilaceae bacterium]|nr:gamma-glutamyltransferase [Dermatophilaceae bacterium]